MKLLSRAFLLVLLTFSISRTCLAEENFGIGIVLGFPTGVSFRSQVSQRQQLNLALGWGHDAILGTADFVNIHKNFIVENRIGADGYWGGGIFLEATTENTQTTAKEHQEVAIGARLPLGLKYIFAPERAEVFAELAPAMQLVPSTHFILSFAIGARYLF